MIKVWYSNTQSINVEEFNMLMSKLPVKYKLEINKYRCFEDKLARLISKLLILKAIIDTGYSRELFYLIQQNEQHKPYIKEWISFNISHSLNYVILAFAENDSLGIDIEFKDSKLEIDSLLNYFCLEEQKIVRSSLYPGDTFIELWVKKEAVLKAHGIGIINGLNELNCIDNNVDFKQQNWVLNKLEIDRKFVSYVASTGNNKQVEVREIHNKELIVL